MSGQITPGSNYSVQSGDTLSGIAQQAYSDGSQPYWMALYNANRSVIGDNPNLIYPGEELWIPPIEKSPRVSSLYVVQEGDTLSGIAQQAHVEWMSIYETNKNVIGNDPNLIQPGQVLSIPSGDGSFQVTAIDMMVSPTTIAGIACGTAITVTYTATFHIAANSPGGTIQFFYTVNNGRSSPRASVSVGPGETTATYSFTWSGKLPDDHTYPGRGGVWTSSPNAVYSPSVMPAGMCS